MQEVLIKDKKYIYNDNIRADLNICKSFNQLAKEVFELGFENWYNCGYWDELYIPHVLIEDSKVVANVSVNIVETVWNNIKKIYLQLGTVMTMESYRRKGLSDYLMRKVLEKWKDRADLIYLFANDTVLNFYPKYDFIPAKEFQCSKKISALNSTSHLKQLNMTKEADRVFLIDKYLKHSNPFSKLPIMTTPGLIMFNCMEIFYNNIFYIEDLDTIAIIDYQGDKLLCYDIYSKKENKLDDILSRFYKANIQEVQLFFTPLDENGYISREFKCEDLTLFIFNEKENVFKTNKVMLNIFAHA